MSLFKQIFSLSVNQTHTIATTLAALTIPTNESYTLVETIPTADGTDIDSVLATYKFGPGQDEYVKFSASNLNLTSIISPPLISPFPYPTPVTPIDKISYFLSTLSTETKNNIISCSPNIIGLTATNATTASSTTPNQDILVNLFASGLSSVLFFYHLIDRDQNSIGQPFYPIHIILPTDDQNDYRLNQNDFKYLNYFGKILICLSGKELTKSWFNQMFLFWNPWGPCFLPGKEQDYNFAIFQALSDLTCYLHVEMGGACDKIVDFHQHYTHALTQINRAGDRVQIKFDRALLALMSTTIIILKTLDERGREKLRAVEDFGNTIITYVEDSLNGYEERFQGLGYEVTDRFNNQITTLTADLESRCKNLIASLEQKEESLKEISYEIEKKTLDSMESSAFACTKDITDLHKNCLKTLHQSEIESTEKLNQIVESCNKQQFAFAATFELNCHERLKAIEFAGLSSVSKLEDMHTFQKALIVSETQECANKIEEMATELQDKMKSRLQETSEEFSTLVYQVSDLGDTHKTTLENLAQDSISTMKAIRERIADVSDIQIDTLNRLGESHVSKLSSLCDQNAEVLEKLLEEQKREALAKLIKCGSDYISQVDDKMEEQHKHFTVEKEIFLERLADQVDENCNHFNSLYEKACLTLEEKEDNSKAVSELFWKQVNNVQEEITTTVRYGVVEIKGLTEEARLEHEDARLKYEDARLKYEEACLEHERVSDELKNVSEELRGKIEENLFSSNNKIEETITNVVLGVKISCEAEVKKMEVQLQNIFESLQQSLQKSASESILKSTSDTILEFRKEIEKSKTEILNEIEESKRLTLSKLNSHGDHLTSQIFELQTGKQQMVEDLKTIAQNRVEHELRGSKVKNIILESAEDINKEINKTFKEGITEEIKETLQIKIDETLKEASLINKKTFLEMSVLESSILKCEKICSNYETEIAETYEGKIEGLRKELTKKDVEHKNTVRVLNDKIQELDEKLNTTLELLNKVLNSLRS